MLLVLEIVCLVLLWYVTLCALWFAGVFLLDVLYLKSSRNPNGDAGLAVLAIALVPTAPLFWLADWLSSLRKV